MKRIVRLAVGSLCLLVLMVNAAPAADPPPRIFCLWGSYRADSVATQGGWTAEVSLSNISKDAQQYQLVVTSKEHPQGVGKTVTLAGSETQTYDCKAIGADACVRQGFLEIISTAYPVADLLLTNSNGGVVMVPSVGCFSDSQ